MAKVVFLAVFVMSFVGQAFAGTVGGGQPLPPGQIPSVPPVSVDEPGMLPLMLLAASLVFVAKKFKK